MSIIKNKYDKSYFENILYREIPNSQRNKNRLKEILKYKKNGKLLEMGCGEGGFLKLATKNFNVKGMDISTYAVNIAKKSFGNKVSFKDVIKVNLEPDYYDVIVIFNLLEHLKEPRLVAKKIHKSLKKNGIVIGSVPNNFSLIGGLATKLMNFIDKTHCSTHPPKYWYYLFKEANFNKITFFGEIMTSRNINKYIKNRFWKYLSFNMIFICKK